MPDTKITSRWRSVSYLGIGLIAVGLAAIATDFLTKGYYSEYLSYDLLFEVIAAGLIVLLIGLAGLAWGFGKSGRTVLGAKALFLPIAFAVCGGLLGGTNIHGIFPIFIFSMLPISFKGLILLLVAAFTSKD